jgi:hypothetical protein
VLANANSSLSLQTLPGLPQRVDDRCRGALGTDFAFSAASSSRAAPAACVPVPAAAIAVPIVPATDKRPAAAGISLRPGPTLLQRTLFPECWILTMLVMFEVFITILKNEDGFTAIEYGLIAAMVLVLASQVVSQF